MMDPNKAMYDQGRFDALNTQKKAPSMTGTQLYSATDSIPDFKEAVKVKNMLARKAGFVCKSTAGRMVRLLQPYDSNVYTAEPEDLPAQWGFAWSKNPEDALPFVSIATSPYNTDEVCSDEGIIYASTMDHNVYRPKDYPQGWRKVN